jgi:hypothetical protein
MALWMASDRGRRLWEHEVVVGEMSAGCVETDSQRGDESRAGFPLSSVVSGKSEHSFRGASSFYPSDAPSSGAICRKVARSGNDLRQMHDYPPSQEHRPRALFQEAFPQCPTLRPCAIGCSGPLRSGNRKQSHVRSRYPRPHCPVAQIHEHTRTDPIQLAISKIEDWHIEEPEASRLRSPAVDASSECTHG